MMLVIFVGAWSGVKVSRIGCVFLLSPQPVNQHDHPRMNRVVSSSPDMSRLQTVLKQNEN